MLLLTTSLLGCDGDLRSPDWEGDVFLTISGPVEPGLPDAPGALEAVLAWAWVLDGQLGATVEPVRFEPRVYRYSLDVVRPPDPAEGAAMPAPEGVESDALLGAAVLYARADPDAGLPSPDPFLLWTSLLDGRIDRDALSAPAGITLLGTWTEHRLGLAKEGPVPAIMSDVPHDLVLLRNDPSGPWAVVAGAGERDELQGVPLGPFF